MQTYIMVLGFYICESVVTGYISPTTPPTDAARKNPSENNAKAMNAILCSLSEFEFVKVMHCDSTNFFGDNLQDTYEGDDMVKKAKLQSHRG